MKRNWIRLLSILLTAVMIFPAASFAYAAAPAGGDIELYVNATYQIQYEDETVKKWESNNTACATVSGISFGPWQVPERNTPAVGLSTGLSFA